MWKVQKGVRRDSYSLQCLSLSAGTGRYLNYTEHRPEGHKGSGEQGLRVAKPAVSTWGVLGWITLKTHPRDLAVKSPGQAFYNGQVPSFQRSLVRVVESSISEERAPRGIPGTFIEGVTFEMDLER